MSDLLDGLRTLRFECFLSEDEASLSPIRAQCRGLTKVACAQATYLVSLIRDARLIDKKHIGKPSDSSKSGAFDIGIIGCGRLGQQLANCLLTFGEIATGNLKISTRRPEVLTSGINSCDDVSGHMASRGVTCCCNNAAVASSVSVLFLCCLPAHLPTVAEELNGMISPQTIVYSFVTAVPVTRLRQLLGTNNVIRPDMTTTTVCCQNIDVDKDVDSSFHSMEFVEQTCPLSYHKQEAMIVTSDRFAEVLVGAFVNSLVDTAFTVDQKLTLVNALVLGHTKQTQLSRAFVVSDFIDTLTSKAPTDLVQLATSSKPSTQAGQKLLTDDVIRRAFVNRYCDVFYQHVRWTVKMTDGFVGVSTRRKYLNSLLT